MFIFESMDLRTTMGSLLSNSQFIQKKNPIKLTYFNQKKPSIVKFVGWILS